MSLKAGFQIDIEAIFGQNKSYLFAGKCGLAGMEALRLNSGCEGDAEDEAEETLRCLLTFFFFPMLKRGRETLPGGAERTKCVAK